MEHPNLVYKKDDKLEEIDNKIADIFAEAVYSYILRKGLLKRKIRPITDSENKIIDK